MKKTCVFLAGILLVILIIFACEMPNSVKFNSDKFQVNAPVKIGRFNVATVLSETLKAAFPEGFEIYDMVDYPDVLAFLIAYPLNISESFNPDDYLKDIKNEMNTMDNLASDGEISSSITINNMSTPPLENDPWQYFDMDSFFENMRTTINNNSCLKKSDVISYTHNTGTENVTVPFELQNLPAFMAFVGGDNSNDSNFDSIVVDEGEIELNIWLAGVSDNNLTVTLSGIELKGATDNNIIGVSPIPPATLSLPNNNYSTTVTVNINGATITKDNPPRFHLGSITSTYTGSTPTSFSYTLFVQPQIKEGITLSEAVALKRGTMDHEIPPQIVDNIEMTPDAEMINAQIKTGKFRMTVESPHYINPNTNSDNGLNIGYQIVMKQCPPDYSLPSSQCLNNKEFTDTNYLLDNQWISGKPLMVKPFPESKIIITADEVNGSTFSLVSSLVGKQLPIQMDMGMDIDELKIVRWESSALPPDHTTPIDFKGEHETSSIKTITFSEIKLNVDFIVPGEPGDPPSPPTSGLPEALKTHIALKVSCPELGFDNSPDNPRKLVEENNQFDGTPTKLEVDDSQVEFNVKLLPVINNEAQEDSPYMEFGPVIMIDDNGDPLDKVNMDIYAEVTMDYEWSEAEIDLEAALTRSDKDAPGGKYPDEDKDPVDLSEFGKYMHGITFGDGIQAKVFLSGPRKLIEIIQPQVDFIARWQGEDEEPMTEVMFNKEDIKIGEEFPKLSGEDTGGELVYFGLDLPEPDGGIVVSGSLGKVLASFPQDLRFRYDVKVPDAERPLTVYPDTFDDAEEGEEGTLKALLVILMPLEFKAEPGGYFAMPGLFGNSDDSEDGEDGKVAADIFGREKASDDSLFTGINVKSLGFRMDFGNSFYSGSRLHFDRDDILFGEDGISVGNGNSLNISFSGEHLRSIDENLIYPDIKFVFPEEKILQVGRYFLPVRVVISASGSYTFDLDDLELGN